MRFEKYHFHIYFEFTDLSRAQDLVQELEQIHHIGIGRIWNKPVGPHPVGSCQITVYPNYFHEMSDWFLLNRKGLSIFIHAVSGDDLKDHTDYVMWIGEPTKLNLDFFNA